MNVIETTNLTKYYGKIKGVEDLTFSVNKGEIFGFLGPNGAGKTTTVEMIEAIREPTAGKIRLLEHDIRYHFNIVKNMIGVLPQEFHSFERLTVRETLVYFSKLYKKRANIEEIINITIVTPVIIDLLILSLFLIERILKILIYILCYTIVTYTDKFSDKNHLQSCYFFV